MHYHDHDLMLTDRCDFSYCTEPKLWKDDEIDAIQCSLQQAQEVSRSYSPEY